MLVLLLAGGAGAATITVNASGGGMYTRIQDAINNSNNGDTITVAAGIYNENVVVNKSVSLIGAGAEVTIVQAANSNDDVFNISMNNVNITGFKLTGATGSVKSGIYLSYSGNNNITGNNASNNSNGIYLVSSSNNNIISNNALNNWYHGICLVFSGNNNITGNNATNNDNWGIYLYSSDNNNLIGNNAFNLTMTIVFPSILPVIIISQATTL